MSTRQANLFTRLTLFVLCFSLILPADVVLCQGSDGHVEIELARGGNCNACLDADDHEQPLELAADQLGEPHCGSCLDFALAVPDYSHQRKQADRHAPSCAVLVAQIDPHTGLGELTYETSYPRPASVPSQTVAALKTIRLLI